MANATLLAHKLKSESVFKVKQMQTAFIKRVDRSNQKGKQDKQ